MIRRLFLLFATTAIAVASLWGLGQIPYTQRGLSTVVGLVGGASLLYALLTLGQFGNYRRTRLLAQDHPGSIVQMAVRTAGLAVAFRDLGLPESLPSGLTILISKESLSIWGGIFSLRKYLDLPLSNIESVVATDVRAGPRTFRGLELTLRERSGATSLPIIITGSGLVGASPPPRAALVEMASAIMARAQLGR
jgi:hypothetical protein